MDITLPVKKASQGRQFPLQIRRHLLQYQAFPRIIKYRDFLSSHFLQDPVSQAPEAEHIDIHNASPVI